MVAALAHSLPLQLAGKAGRAQPLVHGEVEELLGKWEMRRWDAAVS